MTVVGVEGGVDDLVALRRDLRRVPEELRPKVRREVKRAGDVALQRARANASWSSRIPAALAIRVRFTGNRAGVTIYARNGVAPHARPFEGITGAGSFAHPVFGNRGVWVQQATRSYLRPAAEETAGEFRDGIQRAVNDALRDADL